jgi:AAA family ATP:ADP antiporter
MGEPRTLRTHPELQSLQSFPLFRTLGEKPKSRLEKFLSLFADVRAGEGLSVVLLTLNTFLLLAGYYLVKTAREPLILTQGGAEVKAYSSAGQALVLLALIPLYGWVSSHLNRVKLIAGLSLFFAANLVVFALLGAAGVHIAVFFYIWVGIFSVFSVSQIWAFANDLYTEGQGKRLFALIGAGSSVGAIAGSAFASVLFKQYGFTAYSLMLLCAAALLVTMVLIVVVNRREGRYGEAQVRQEGEAPLGPEGGFQLILRDRYLLWIALLIVLLNIVNTSGEYLLDKLLTLESVKRFGEDAASLAERQRFIGGFKGEFFSVVNLVGALLQTFFVSRLFRFAGVRGALFVLPCIALVSYSIFAVAPVLLVVRIVKTFENASDYSIQNTVRQALWLPTSREAKYKAKAAVDSFFTRFGDVLAAGVIYAATAIQATLPVIGALNIALTALWLYVASRIAREHRRRTV